MAMTVRLPEELDARLEALARARGTSKHAILIEATDRFVSSEARTAHVLEVAQDMAERYAETLDRLSRT